MIFEPLSEYRIQISKMPLTYSVKNDSDILSVMFPHHLQVYLNQMLIFQIFDDAKDLLFPYPFRNQTELIELIVHKLQIF